MCQETDAIVELLRRQANLSELKKSFLEMHHKSSGGSEWDKRLASSLAHYPRLNDPSIIGALLFVQDVRWIVGSGIFAHACLSERFFVFFQGNSAHCSIDMACFRV